MRKVDVIAMWVVLTIFGVLLLVFIHPLLGMGMIGFGTYVAAGEWRKGKAKITPSPKEKNFLLAI